MIGIMEIFVPFALYGFTAYYFASLGRGDIFYGIAKKLWIWLRQSERKYLNQVRITRQIYQIRQRYRDAAVIGMEDPAYSKIIEKKLTEGYINRTVEPTLSGDFITDKLDDICAIDPNGKPAKRFRVIQTGGPGYESEFFVLRDYHDQECKRYEKLYLDATNLSNLERKSKELRRMLITPFAICPICGLFWLSPVAYSILWAASHLSPTLSLTWANYPLHLFAAFALIIIFRK